MFAQSNKPYAPSCDRNREPILEVLRVQFGARRRVLEIGSGTGQHAVHFAAALPGLLWQTSDRRENLPGIGAWLDEAALPNTPPPLLLDVNQPAWLTTSPQCGFDALFTANTLHIMSWQEVQHCFQRLTEVMDADASLVIYGPFNYRGRHTSDSNAAFDVDLRSRAPHMGLRDFEAVDDLARSAGFRLLSDQPMPANNRCLSWIRGR